MDAEHPVQPNSSAGADLAHPLVWSADLDEADKSRLLGTIASDPDVAADLRDLLEELPAHNRRRLVRYFAQRLASTPYSRDAVLPALDDLLTELTLHAAKRHLSAISANR